MDSDDKLRKRRALGDALRRLRANRRLSQEDLALEAAVDRSYLGRIERGEAAMSVDKIWQICQALEVSPVELFTQAMAQEKLLRDKEGLRDKGEKKEAAKRRPNRLPKSRKTGKIAS